MHYEGKPLIPLESLAKTKYKTFKRKVRVLNLFSELQEVEVAKKQPFGAFFGIFHLFERKYFIADKK